MPRQFESENRFESPRLSCHETMVMIASNDRTKFNPAKGKKPTDRGTGVAFRQISLITYGLYKGDSALTMTGLSGVTKADSSHGITPTRAAQILEQCKPRHWRRAGGSYKSWLTAPQTVSRHRTDSCLQVGTQSEGNLATDWPFKSNLPIDQVSRCFFTRWWSKLFSANQSRLLNCFVRLKLDSESAEQAAVAAITSPRKENSERARFDSARWKDWRPDKGQVYEHLQNAAGGE